MTAETYTPAGLRVHEATGATITAYRGRESRHDVTIGTRRLEVRPDGGASSGANRSRVINETLDALAAGRIDPIVYLIGALTAAGASALEVVHAE